MLSDIYGEKFLIEVSDAIQVPVCELTVLQVATHRRNLWEQWDGTELILVESTPYDVRSEVGRTDAICYGRVMRFRNDEDRLLFKLKNSQYIRR